MQDELIKNNGNMDVNKQLLFFSLRLYYVLKRFSLKFLSQISNFTFSNIADCKADLMS